MPGPHSGIIFFAGDHESIKGPSRVNQAYLGLELPWLAAPYPRPTLRQLVEFVTGRYSGLVVSSLSKYHVLLLIAARVVRRPSWYLAHGMTSRERSGLDPQRRIVEWSTIRIASEVICVSEILAQDLRLQYRNKRKRFTVVANGADVGLSKRARTSRPSGPVSVVSVGTAPLKNAPKLIEALELAKEDFDLTLVGHWPERSCLGVSHVAALSPHELMQLMRRTDIYVQASRAEPFGLAIMEAAAAGCELLVPRNAGCVPLLPSLTQDNVIRDVTDAGEVARKLDVIAGQIRQGRAKTHATTRTWMDAADELHQVLARRAPAIIDSPK